MSKKYFTKYLPVKGDYQEDGDLVIDLHHPEPRVHESIQGCKKEGCKSVKLFLCSRDIQVGDEILIDGFPHIKPTKVVNIEITNPDHSVHIPIYNCENGDWYEIHEIFKVIGEISPDALSYVREEQEFIQEDLRWAIVDENGNKEDECFLDDIDAPAEGDYIMVVCPTCQTFH